MARPREGLITVHTLCDCACESARACDYSNDERPDGHIDRCVLPRIVRDLAHDCSRVKVVCMGVQHDGGGRSHPAEQEEDQLRNTQVTQSGRFLDDARAEHRRRELVGGVAWRPHG